MQSGASLGASLDALLCQLHFIQGSLSCLTVIVIKTIEVPQTAAMAPIEQRLICYQGDALRVRQGGQGLPGVYACRQILPEEEPSVRAADTARFTSQIGACVVPRRALLAIKPTVAGGNGLEEEPDQTGSTPHLHQVSLTGQRRFSCAPAAHSAAWPAQGCMFTTFVCS